MRLSLRSLDSAHFTNFGIDERLQRFWIGARVTPFDVLRRTVKEIGADGLLNEFREIALFHTLRSQKRAETEIRLFRDLNVPANCLFHI